MRLSRKKANKPPIKPPPLQKPPSPSPPTDLDTVDIIAYETVAVGSDDDIRTIAERAVNRAMGSAGYGAAGEGAIYGNQAGRDLLQNRDDMREDMKRLTELVMGNVAITTELRNEVTELRAENAVLRAENAVLRAENAELKAEVAKNKIQIADLQDRVENLTLAADGYRDIRHRFIDFYRRDILKNVTPEGRNRIKEGNMAAHEGDAVVDATLYTTGKRHDEDVLILLYGLTPSQIKFLAKAKSRDSIATLNTGATWRAKGIPENVDDAFESFINELKANISRGESGDITGRDTPLGRAYNMFWEAHNSARSG